MPFGGEGPRAVHRARAIARHIRIRGTRSTHDARSRHIWIRRVRTRHPCSPSGLVLTAVPVRRIGVLALAGSRVVVLRIVSHDMAP